MIITEPTSKDTKLVDTSPSHLEAGPSNAPPSYSDNTPLLIKDGGDLEMGPPPTFSEYQADAFVSSGNTVTHDAHLNQDGEALYRFLLSQSMRIPAYFLSIKGSHNETRTRLVSGRDNNGNLKTTTETYTETVVDFDFQIDIGRNASTEPQIWSLPDSESAYRGRSFQQIDTGSASALGLKATGRTKAKRRERKMSKAWSNEAREKGYPPWVGSVHRYSTLAQLASINSQASSRTLRQWADEYCASKMSLKQFTFRKVMYGWDIDALKSAVRSTVHTTGYNGQLYVEFETEGDLVIVRPDTTISRILSKDRWAKFFLIITLVYPIVWLWAWIVGGRWDICGAAFALKKTGDSTTTSTGLKEGEWLRAWEGTIKHSVNAGRKDAGWILREPIPGAVTDMGLGATSRSMGRGGMLPGLHPSFTLDGYVS